LIDEVLMLPGGGLQLSAGKEWLRCVCAVAKLRLNCLKGEKLMYDKLAGLFKEWLEVFEAIQAKTEKAAVVEARVAARPAKGPPGLVVKLGLH